MKRLTCKDWKTGTASSISLYAQRCFKPLQVSKAEQVRQAGSRGRGGERRVRVVCCQKGHAPPSRQGQSKRDSDRRRVS